ncbi:hypothetical protein B0H17DRAFT_1200619 [Mycena rosella]|uniref:Uncharacterized protein n=1 Tax=Mycena rosella TaxID=1033263 RepID=A0AAD7GFD2_MYCRO|nr:hypothetical protein B0H17DRAFT_1200619 [Mycena rosella]
MRQLLAGAEFAITHPSLWNFVLVVFSFLVIRALLSSSSGRYRISLSAWKSRTRHHYTLVEKPTKETKRGVCRLSTPTRPGPALHRDDGRGEHYLVLQNGFRTRRIWTSAALNTWERSSYSSARQLTRASSLRLMLRPMLRLLGRTTSWLILVFSGTMVASRQLERASHGLHPLGTEHFSGFEISMFPKLTGTAIANLGGPPRVIDLLGVFPTPDIANGPRIAALSGRVQDERASLESPAPRSVDGRVQCKFKEPRTLSKHRPLGSAPAVPDCSPLKFGVSFDPVFDAGYNATRYPALATSRGEARIICAPPAFATLGTFPEHSSPCSPSRPSSSRSSPSTSPPPRRTLAPRRAPPAPAHVPRASCTARVWRECRAVGKFARASLASYPASDESSGKSRNPLLDSAHALPAHCLTLQMLRAGDPHGPGAGRALVAAYTLLVHDSWDAAPLAASQEGLGAWPEALQPRCTR